MVEQGEYNFIIQIIPVNSPVSNNVPLVSVVVWIEHMLYVPCADDCNWNKQHENKAKRMNRMVLMIFKY